MSVVGQLVSAASLGVFAVSVVELAGRSGRGSAALQAAGAAGGALTVATVGISALTSLRLTQGRAEDPDTAVRLPSISDPVAEVPAGRTVGESL